MESTRPTVVVVGPTPPPYAGVEVATANLLRSSLNDAFRLVHVRSNVHRSNTEKGRVGPRALAATAGMLLRLIRALAVEHPAAVLLPLSQNPSGFLRDAAVLAVAGLFARPRVAVLHGGNFRAFHDRLGPAGRALVRWALRRLDRLIVLGERIRDDLAGLTPTERLAIVPNGVPVGEFSGPSRADAGAPTVLFVGHLSAAKGYYDLLDAMRRVWAERPEARLVCLGEPVPVERNLPGVGAARPGAGVAERDPRVTRLWGMNGAEKTARFAAATVFALPSYAEGLPLAVLEAMAAGLPMVLTPVGAVPEVAGPDQARFVEPGDVEGLARALLDLLRDPDRRAQMGARNRKAAARYDLGVMGRRMSEVIRSVLPAAA